MDSGRCVEIFCDDGSYGSGYALTNSCVLTACHVVRNIELDGQRAGIRVRLLANWKEKRIAKHTADVVWSNAEHDIALLRVTDKDANWPTLPLPEFGTVVDQEFHEFEAQGFPKFRETEDNSRDVYPATGTFTRSVKTPFLRLSIPNNTPRTPEMWRGFSGSAIFSEQCLVGVVRSVDRVVQGALDGSALSSSVLDEQFAVELQMRSRLVLKDVGLASRSSSAAKPKYADRLDAETLDELEEISAFFSICTRLEEDGISNLVGLKDLVDSFPRLSPGQNQRNRQAPWWIRLRGARGAGKTTLLSALFSAVKSCALSERDRRTPLFIDAESLRLNSDPQVAINEAITDVEKLAKSGYFVLMVDGLSARDQGWSGRLCRQMADRIPFATIDAVIWSMPEDFENQFEDLTREQRDKVKPKILDLIIEVIGEQDKRFSDYLRAFVRLHRRLVGDAGSEISKKVLQRFDKRVKDFSDGGEIDQHMMSLIYRSLEWPKYAAVTNMAVFMEMYCADRMLGDTFDRENDPDEIMRALQEAAWLSFRDLIQNLYTKPTDIPALLTISDSDRASLAWKLSSEHNNIRDFLAAWYVFDRLRTAVPGSAGDAARRDIVEHDVLGYDFPQIINALVRSLIEVQRGKKDVIRNIGKLVSMLMNAVPPKPQTMNFLCYLLGRFPAEAPASILDQAYKSVQGRLNAGNYSERLHAKTQARTIAVSQMRLNMHEAGDKFLCGLLRDSELASIDRGYHRLYYSDCVACRDKAPECYLDSPGSSWSKTFKKLQASLKEEFPELGNYTSTQSQDGASAGDGQSVLRQEVQHKIVTLLLFVQSRLGSVNQLETDRHDFARQVIECALRREGWAQELRNYMEMMRVDLGDRDAGKWRLVLDLYRLKWEPRRGWLVRGLHPAFHVGRIESVADHSYFAILLATLLLPPSSSKDETIRILAVHDVAEAYTGDIIFRKLQGDQLGAARIKESEVHDYLCWKETYEGIYDTFPLHERLRAITAESPGTSQQLESVRAAIDIDRMENLIQLYIYRDLYDDWIKPEEFQSFADGLTESMHTEVRNLAKDFVSWADTRRGHLFQDPPRFFDPSLVVMQERVQKQAR